MLKFSVVNNLGRCWEKVRRDGLKSIHLAIFAKIDGTIRRAVLAGPGGGARGIGIVRRGAHSLRFTLGFYLFRQDAPAA
jgi:hypothetical protein